MDFTKPDNDDGVVSSPTNKGSYAESCVLSIAFEEDNAGGQVTIVEG